MNRSRHRASWPIRDDADGECLSKSGVSHTGPAPYDAPAAAAAAAPPPQRRDTWRQGGGGLLAALRRQNTYRGAPMEEQHPDLLPAHQQPRDVVTTHARPAEMWGEVVSLRDSGDELYLNEARGVGDGAGAGAPVRFTPTTAPRPAAGEYAEGELAGAPGEYNLYREDGRGNDLSETGRGRRHRESREARIERFAAA